MGRYCEVEVIIMFSIGWIYEKGRKRMRFTRITDARAYTIALVGQCNFTAYIHQYDSEGNEVLVEKLWHDSKTDKYFAVQKYATHRKYVVSPKTGRLSALPVDVSRSVSFYR